MTAQQFNRVSGRKLGENWGWVLASGILFIAIGLFAMAQPLVTGVAVGIVLGTALLSGGLIAVATGVANLRVGGAWLYIAIGLLGALLGARSLFSPVAGALALVGVMGAWLMVGGIMEAVSGFKIENRHTGLIVLGIVNILLGGILLGLDPASALAYLGIIIGVSFLLRGVGSIMLALSLRRLLNR
jgi:uncharacterized membrane protein HdeD (DUF308 family)